MNKKKLLALLMALVMTFSLVPVTALAEETEASFNPTGADNGWIDGSFANALDYEYNFESLGEHKAISIQLNRNITLSENMSFPDDSGREVIYSVSSGVTDLEFNYVPVTIDPGSYKIMIPDGVTVVLEDVNHVEGVDHNIELFSAPEGYNVIKATYAESYSIERADAATPAWTHIWDENKDEATEELLNATPYQITAHLWLDGGEAFSQPSKLDPDETIGESLDALWAALYAFSGDPRKLANDISVQVTDVVNYVAKIGETKYTTLQAAIDAVEDNNVEPVTIQLLDDVTAGSGLATNSTDADGHKKNIIIDLGGHTYTVEDPAVGSTNTKSQAMHWAEGSTVVLKNGTITTSENATGVKMFLQNYANLTLQDVTLDASKIPVSHYDDPKYQAYPVWYGKVVPLFGFNKGNAVIEGKTTIKFGENSGSIAVGERGGTLTIGSSNANIDGQFLLESNAEGVLNISAGKYASDPRSVTYMNAEDTYIDCVASGKTVAVSSGRYQVVASDKVEATVDDANYTAFSAAIKAVKGTSGKTVVLVKDTELTGILNRFTLDNQYDFTLDLGGHTLVMNGAHFTLKGANLTVTNGRIETKGNFSQEFTVNSGTLTIEDSATVIGVGKISPIGIFGPATVNTSGILRAADSFAIAGNGSNGKGGYTINVTGGEVSSTGASAIYHPNIGTLNVSGGTITGTTGIYQKSGTMNITGGNITGNGAAAGYTYNGNGANATGDAIVIDNCGYPGGVPTANIGNATIESAHGKQIGYYVNANSEEGTVKADKRYTLSTNVPTKGWAANGEEQYPVKIGTPEAVAKVGDVAYGTLAAAIADANVNGGTVTLLRDYDMEANEPGYGWTTLSHSARENCLVISGNVTFDLDGHTLSNLFNNTFKITGNVTIQNGEMKVGKYNNGAYCSYVMMTDTGATLTVNDLTTFGGINVSGANATINNLSFSGTTFYAVCSQDDATVTLNGGNYTKAVPGAANHLFWVEEGSTMNITGGNYVKGSAKFNNGKTYPFITGGTFDFDPTNYGVAPGYEAVDNDNGTWTVRAKAVAKIGTVEYTTLQAAFDDAKDGETIQLIADATMDSRVFVNAGAKTLDPGSRYATTSDTRSITLDLNGHNISGESNIALAGGSLNVTGTGTISTSTGGLAPIEVRGTGDLTAKRTLTIGSGVTLKGSTYGLNIFGSNDEQANKIDVMVNGTVNGQLFVLGNLKNTSNAINIVVSDSAKLYSIAENGYANVTINGGSFNETTNSCVEVRAGTLTINGGTFTNTAESFNCNSNVSGTTTKGAAIAIAQHTTDKPINVTINGGTFTGPCALSIANPQNNATNNVTVSVTGGSFKGTTSTVAQTVNNDDNRVTGFISGGIFYNDAVNSGDPSIKGTGYVASGYEAVEIDNDWYQVGEIKSTAIAKTTTGNTDTEATYTASRRVVDKNAETIGESYRPTVTVNLSASSTGTVATNNKLPQYDQEKIVAKALEVSNAAEMTVSIDVKHDNPTPDGNKITYEVHPEATVTSGNETVGTFTVTNDMLSGQTFTIKLLVPEALRNEETGKVKVTHKLNNGDKVVYNELPYDAEYYVTIADVTEFSEFELEKVVEAVNPSASCGFTLALKDKIEIPLYVYNLNEDASHYHVEYSYTNASGVAVDETVTLGDKYAVSGAPGWYRVVVASFSARQMGDTVHVKLYTDANNPIFERDYSIREYCEGRIEHSPNEKLKNLCRATLDYGRAAQINFNYTTGNQVSDGYYNDLTKVKIGSEYSASNPAEFGFVGTTISLKSQVVINFYFEDTGNYTYTVNGEVKNPVPSGNYKVIRVDGISAKNLDKQVTVTVSDGTTSQDFSYSPMNYAYGRQQNSKDQNLINVCKALYLYCAYANDYLN